MAELRKRNGKWMITIRNPNIVGNSKKSKTKTFDSKLEALVWSEKMQQGFNSDDNNELIFSDKTFADVARLYLEQVTPMKKGSCNESIIINRLIREIWCNIKLSQLTLGHLVTFRDARLTKVRPSTFNREWVLIRSIARFAPANDIPLNQTIFSELRKPTVYERPVERITSQMEAKLLETARLAGNRVQYMVHFINFALGTAMRRGEMCSLEWEHVDMSNRRIYVLSHKAKSGKGRTIPMTQRTYDALVGLKSLRRFDRKVGAMHPFVIPATGNAVRLAFGRIRKLAGLEHIRIHDFRHESISRFHEAGLTLPEIQSISGHADLEMLARYSHASADNLVAKLGGVK